MLVHWDIILIKSPEVTNNDKIMNMAVFINENNAKGTYTTNSLKYNNLIQAFSNIPVLSRHIELSENQSIIRKQSFKKWFPDFENIYVKENPTSQMVDIFSNLYPRRYDDSLVVRIINKTNLRYVVIFSESTMNTGFFSSIRTDKNIIYDDGSEVVISLK